MRFYQLISTDESYDLSVLLKKAFEQRPQGIIENINNEYFNSLMIFKRDEIVNFIFGTNYKAESFPVMLKKNTNKDMVFYDTEYISELSTFKYSKNILRKDYLINLFDDEDTFVTKETIDELPEGLMLSIKFRRSNKGSNLEKSIINKEQELRNKNRKETTEKSYQEFLSERQGQLNYLYDVQIELVSKNKEEDSKAHMLAYYNVLKVYMNNRYNNIKIDNWWSDYLIDKIKIKHQLVHQELYKFIYIPNVNDFSITGAKDLPIHYMESNYYIPNDDEFNEGVLMGYLKHPFIKDRAIRIPISQLETHLMTAGQSGSGKTSSVHENLDSEITTPTIKTYEDLVADEILIKHKKSNTHGYSFIDPKKLSALRVINHLLYKELMGEVIDWERIHYIDLHKGDYVPSFNLLDRPTYRTTGQIIDRTLELFKDVYDSGSTPLMDKNMRNIIGALVLGKDDATILDAIRLINDTKFRKTVTSKIKGGMNQEIIDFWKGDIKNDSFSSAINRFSLFQSDTMKRLYGRKGMDLDFALWAREGHIVIVNALDLSDTATTLVIGQLAQLLFEQIINVGKVPGFRLVIDEGKRAQVSALHRISAEGREAGAWSDFSTQDINLMNKTFTQSLLGNTSNFKIGRHEISSAKKMSDLLNNDIDSDTIANLPNNTMILRTSNKKGEFVKMKVTSKPPYWYLPDGSIAEYKNEEQEAMAMQWAEDKAVELQKRDWLHKDEIDKILFKDNKDVFDNKIFDSVDEEGNVKLFE